MPGRQALLVALAVLAVLLLAGCAAGAPRAAGFAGREGLAGPPSLVPLGLVVASVAGEVPAGWLECDGRDLGKFEYPGLYAVVGDAFGPAPEGRFLLPDLRGRFVRCVDNNRGLDPGRALGTYQEDALQYHRHPIATPVIPTWESGGTYEAQADRTVGEVFPKIPGMDALAPNVISQVVQTVPDDQLYKMANSYLADLYEAPTWAQGDGEKTRPVSMEVRYIISSQPTEVIPTGVMVAFAGRGDAPAGWLKCNGQEYDPAEYGELSAALAGKFTVGALTAGYFQVPDTRGLFLSGAQGVVGTINAQAMKAHSHSLWGIRDTNSYGDVLDYPGNIKNLAYYKRLPKMYLISKPYPPAPSSVGSMNNSYVERGILDASVADEIRPKNMSVQYIIKA